MAGKIIFCIISLGCGVMCYAIGAYAQKLRKPMGFWSGKEVKPAEITDITAYNKENAAMWKVYSLWYFAAGIAEIWNEYVGPVILMLGGTAGIFLLIHSYKKIYRKYKT